MDRGAKSCLGFAHVTDIQRKHLISDQSFLRVHMSFWGGNLEFSKRLWRSRTFTKSQLCLLGF